MQQKGKEEETYSMVTSSFLTVPIIELLSNSSHVERTDHKAYSGMNLLFKIQAYNNNVLTCLRT